MKCNWPECPRNATLSTTINGRKLAYCTTHNAKLNVLESQQVADATARIVLERFEKAKKR